MFDRFFIRLCRDACACTCFYAFENATSRCMRMHPMTLMPMYLNVTCCTWCLGKSIHTHPPLIHFRYLCYLPNTCTYTIHQIHVLCDVLCTLLNVMNCEGLRRRKTQYAGKYNLIQTKQTLNLYNLMPSANYQLAVHKWMSEVHSHLIPHIFMLSLRDKPAACKRKSRRKTGAMPGERATKLRLMKKGGLLGTTRF